MKDRTLPQPVGRRILALIIALFIASVIWLMLQRPGAPETPNEDRENPDGAPSESVLPED